MVKVLDISENDAKKLVQREDKLQRDFFKKNFGKSDASPYEFDLVINCDFITDPRAAAGIITQAYHGSGTYYLPSPANPKQPWKSYKIGGERAGLALYDVDRDGDMDVLNSNVWYENPGDPAQGDHLQAARDIFSNLDASANISRLERINE